MDTLPLMRCHIQMICSRRDEGDKEHDLAEEGAERDEEELYQELRHQEERANSDRVVLLMR